MFALIIYREITENRYSFITGEEEGGIQILDPTNLAPVDRARRKKTKQKLPPVTNVKQVHEQGLSYMSCHS